MAGFPPAKTGVQVDRERGTQEIFHVMQNSCLRICRDEQTRHTRGCMVPQDAGVSFPCLRIPDYITSLNGHVSVETTKTAGRRNDSISGPQERRGSVQGSTISDQDLA